MARFLGYRPLRVPRAAQVDGLSAEWRPGGAARKLLVVSSEAMEVVNRWRASNFERGAVEDVLAEDVEWVVPKGGGVITLRGIDAVLEWYVGGGAADEAVHESLGDPESLDFTEERGELEDFGEGQSARSID